MFPEWSRYPVCGAAAPDAVCRCDLPHMADRLFAFGHVKYQFFEGHSEQRIRTAAVTAQIRLACLGVGQLAVVGGGLFALNWYGRS